MAKNTTAPGPAKVAAREPSRELNMATGETGLAIPQKAIFDPATMQTTAGRPMQIDENRGGLRELTAQEFQNAMLPPGAPPTSVPGAVTPSNLPQAEILPPQSGDLQSTPPPADTGLSQLRLEFEARIAELQEQLQRSRDENEEMRFQTEAFNAQTASRATAPAQLPQNLDPSAPATYGDIAIIAQSLFSMIPAQTIRSMWNVTPTEETQVLRDYPQAQSLAEPQKTQFIQKAVQRMRDRAKKAASTAASAPSPTPATSSSRESAPSRVVTGTIPAPESGGRTASGLTEPQQNNALTEAFNNYYAAQKIRNSRERRDAMQQWANEIARLQGLSDRGAFAQGGFVQRTNHR